MSTAGRRWRRRGGAPYHMSLSFFCHTFSPGNHLPLFDCLSNSFLPHSHLASNYESRSLSFSCSAIDLVTESFHLFPLIYVFLPRSVASGVSSCSFLSRLRVPLLGFAVSFDTFWNIFSALQRCSLLKEPKVFPTDGFECQKQCARPHRTRSTS